MNTSLPRIIHIKYYTISDLLPHDVFRDDSVCLGTEPGIKNPNPTPIATRENSDHVLSK
jgi:hypothetical protein